MDAARFYALLRFEEASLALRAAMKLNLVEQLGVQFVSQGDLCDRFEFTEQGGRTFIAILCAMQVLVPDEGGYRVSERAAQCLAEGIPTSRKPYLAMGMGADVDALIDLLQGRPPADSMPLYSGDDAGPTVMDETEIAREIAWGLASRARNFAAPLAAAIAEQAADATSLADIGAGSPYLAQACLQEISSLETVTLVDRPNGMRFAKEMVRDGGIDDSAFTFFESDFFQSAPNANVYVASNTAHDWRPSDYRKIANNIRGVIPANGVLCIHEPLLVEAWENDTEWLHALWMACYALTLFRITLGEGTCYTRAEHQQILADCGFETLAASTPTMDGCTALFFRPVS